MCPSSLHSVAYGVPMSLIANRPALYAKLPELLPHATEIVATAPADAQRFSLLCDEDEVRYRCCEGEEIILESGDLSSVQDAFKQALMIHVANHAPDRVFVHAGVVACNGRALVLPGPSFAGKSTLTAALVRAGATYYSDEYAVLDENGFVHPYARPLSMRGSGETRQTDVPVSAYGGTAGTECLPVHLVVFTEFRKGARWRAQDVSAGMAVLEMLKHSIPVQRTPARVMATLTAMLQNATIWSSPREEADELAAVLVEWLSEAEAAV
jgi:hypothetical protein